MRAFQEKILSSMPSLRVNKIFVWIYVNERIFIFPSHMTAQPTHVTAPVNRIIMLQVLTWYNLPIGFYTLPSPHKILKQWRPRHKQLLCPCIHIRTTVHGSECSSVNVFVRLIHLNMIYAMNKNTVQLWYSDLFRTEKIREFEKMKVWIPHQISILCNILHVCWMLKMN